MKYHFVQCLTSVNFTVLPLPSYTQQEMKEFHTPEESLQRRKTSVGGGEENKITIKFNDFRNSEHFLSCWLQFQFEPT